MRNPFEALGTSVKTIVAQSKYVRAHPRENEFRNKLWMQVVIGIAFLVLTIVNVVTESWPMFWMTLSGGLINLACAIIGWKTKQRRVIEYSSILTCTLLFAFFIVYGGNDGFAALWVVLLPFLAMAVMNFGFGLTVSIFFQIYLAVIFWTPIKDNLFYTYNEQFCLRFPLLYMVTNTLGYIFTISLMTSRYNEEIHLSELEKLRETAVDMANTDPLTRLANRRWAYERFDADFAEEGAPHSIVMCDIDHFKTINDTYGHTFGDQVLVELAKIFTEHLPPDYMVVRWGGEEFLIAANASLSAVRFRMEDLRRDIEKLQFFASGNRVKVTMTFGISEYTDIEKIEEAIVVADDRMYRGKNSTRNCVIYK